MKTLGKTTIAPTRERVLWTLGVLVALFSGFWGFGLYYQDQPENMSYLGRLYATVGLFVFEFPLESTHELPVLLEIARWLAPGTLSYAAAKALLVLLQSHVDEWNLRRLRGHAIVVGNCDGVLQRSQSLINEGISVVSVQLKTNAQPRTIRNGRSYTLICSTCHADTLNKMNIDCANYLLVATSRNQTNLEIVQEAFIIKSQSRSNTVLQCAVRVVSSDVANSLYDQPVFCRDYDNFTASLMDFSRISARQLLIKHGPHQASKQDLSRCSRVTVLVIGDDAFTEEVVLRLANIGFYGGSDLLNVSLLSRRANQMIKNLVDTRPALQRVVQLIGIESELSSLHKEGIKSICKSAPHFVYMCPSSLESALVWVRVFNSANLQFPAAICVKSQSPLVEWLEAEANRNSGMAVVKLYEQGFENRSVFDQQHDLIAQTIHEHYVKTELEKGETSITNPSLVPWRQLPETLKDANRNQADHLIIKLTLLTGKQDPTLEELQNALTPERIESLAKVEHERWMSEKLLSGWEYTPGRKDLERRLSPLLVPWCDLTERDKQKDRDTIIHLPRLWQLMCKTNVH